jgi:replicative DNA helicase
MSENTENTLTAYLGPEFQQKLMWQILVEPEFAEKIIPDISVEYFDDPNLKRLFLIILEYIKAYEKVPNLQNQSIFQAINLFKTPNNQIEEESLFSVIERIKSWNERVLNQLLSNDGEIVQKSIYTFIRQQEYRKLGEFILDKTRTGEIKQKHILGVIEDKFQKIAHIGDEEDNGTDVTEGLEKALRKEFRQTISTGVDVIDQLTGGGLGKGEIGLILTPSGVGKTTLLTKIANTARELNYNVLQIVFEDTIEQIQRKHVTLWTGIPLTEIDGRNEEALEKSNKHIEKLEPAKLTIKKFSQEDTTMKDIRAWIVREQKKWGFKYDIVIIDYLDCLESHKKSPDRNEAELVIIKSFEAMSADFNIPCWTAIQSNRTGFGAEFVEAQQTGGNIKRYQKSHFFMTVAKTKEQQEASLANIRILKARFAKDGQTFTDCTFNNDTMQIIIRDDRYVGGKTTGIKKYGEAEMEKFAENNANLIHAAISNFEQVITEENINEIIKDVIPVTVKDVTTAKTTSDILELDETEKIIKNDGVIDGVNDVKNDGVKEPLLEITGKTETINVNEPEVKIDVIRPEIVPKIVSETPKTEIKKEKIDIIEAEKKLNIDPDEVGLKQKHVYEILVKKRESQDVVKKE